jgi:cardiolipin synthase A/B
MKRLIQMVLSRTTLVLLLLLAQIILFLFLIDYVSQYRYISTGFYIISVLIVTYLITREENPIYKLSWIIPILIFPLFGGLFYLLYRQRNVSSKVQAIHDEINQSRDDYVKLYKTTSNSKESVYLNRQSWPTYQHTKTDFLASGEALFEALVRDLKEAKSYIFMEFFIINKGVMWTEILDILKLKVKEGVEVKVLYDDFGSSTLPYQYKKKLRSYGIEAYSFNPMRIHLNFAMNYRDHRKIVVIDGNLGYTGGINIGDEYINKITPFGHWQDAGIRLEGRAVWSLLLGFLENWRFTSRKKIDYAFYKGTTDFSENDGFVTPFSDTPLDKELSTKNIYLSLINSAKSTIYITSPYLIIDNELTTALKFAAKSGIDIKIIIPYIADKKIIFMVTESYVPELMEAGVEVYRYQPGFIHSKMMIVDDQKAMIGTANLDFRSLYLHFENMVYLDRCNSVHEMTDFFNKTIDKSVIIKQTDKRGMIYRLLQIIFRGFSSLM